MSVMFMNLGNMARTAWVTTGENKKTIKDERINILQEFWGNNYAHIVITAEADELPQDPEELKSRVGLIGLP